MSERKKLLVLFLIFVAIGIPALLYLFYGDIAVLSPKGMIGEKQRDLLILSTLLMLIVVIPVFIMTFAIAWRYRSSRQKAEYKPGWDYSFLAEAVWWGVPCVLMLILGWITWKSSHELDPYKPIESKTKALTIQAVALQWKWLFIYPEQKIATVNFVQFPEKTPIHFEITADAPMNSFWIPELGGQIYAMAGMRTELNLIANGCDTYAGASANISGEGFSGMKFTAKSCTQQEFQKWVQSVRKSTLSLDMQRYQQLVRPSSYDPAAYYRLGTLNLFDRIVMKYMETDHAH